MPKSMAKYPRVLIGMIVITLIFTGCGQKPRSDAGQEMVVRSVTDFAGRTVQLGKTERLACLFAISGQIVVMLGKAEQIVAVAPGLKRDQILNQLAPSLAVADTPSLGGVINIESLLNTKPDVIFIGPDVYHNKNEAEKLDRTGIPYLVVGYDSMAQQQKMIEMIGDVVGAKEKAIKYNQYYQECIERVQRRIGDVAAEARPRVYHSVVEPLKTDQSPSLPDDWLRSAGAINVSAENQVRSEGNFVSLEQVIVWNPQVIIVNEDGVTGEIMGNPQWRAIEAVNNGKVWQLPVGISRWGHQGGLETPLAILWTAKMLYPDKFADVDMSAEIKRFYREFFAMDVTDELAEKILRGKGMIRKKGETK
jgi:iron complex transport system substrate-binding protein